ncbi:MAG: hypothetical protein K9L82_15315 [Chromatiaceae bacterium]|nr:hypothetical protein [Chromatiaceae bacterium]MCF7996325.1 hypothetical protein [Chromatiaceae bacterium]MCF8016842.1 hypothetical protein [Chromatiaceae bacterium]
MTPTIHPTAIIDEGAQIGWMSEHGEQMPLPLEGEGRYTCPQTGARYRLENGQVSQQAPA